MMVCVKRILTLIVLLLTTALWAQAWQQVNETAPEPEREFRAAWVSTVHNLDWPSRPSLSAAQQRAELVGIITLAAKLRFNAIILQVRPCSDAFYNSRYEPWSCWLSGPGANPGYDPLAFAIQEAHKRGIELHAWFNPYRATTGNNPVGKGHISQRRPDLILKTTGGVTMLTPTSSAAQDHILKVIMDVVQRYDIDGVHLDDYFYPYPPHNHVADGKTPAQRRAAVDNFVSRLYSSVKRAKPYVRVGISPFGIWQPGYPAGVKAGVNAYEHLACDARKWLQKGWVDYLTPQLYWRCKGDQSFPALMQWWSSINPARPVWPGIASIRINSSEDPGRPASEIGMQMDYSRKLARQGAGQVFWRWGSISSNRGGVQKEIAARYGSYAIPPAMPWSGNARPGRPALQAAERGGALAMAWTPADKSARKWVVQARYGRQWRSICILPGGQTKVTLPLTYIGNADRIAVRPVSACGNSGVPAVIAR